MYIHRQYAVEHFNIGNDKGLTRAEHVATCLIT